MSSFEVAPSRQASARVVSPLLLAAAGIAASALAGGASAHAGNPRPPQFVALSFDNCRELDRWTDLERFTSRLREAGKRVELTFFLSGVTLIPDAERRGYAGPHQGAGRSKIGFGGKAEEVAARARLINKLRASGHEVASHAVGHFDARLDGPAWSMQDWVRELTTFRDIVSAGLAKPVPPPTGADGAHDAADTAATLPAPSFRGFRAPYLSTTQGLLPALASLGYRYDASGHGDLRAWPRKTAEGIWRFDLARLQVWGTGRRTLSMDYNFYVAQSGAREDRTNAPRYKTQMVRTYLEYFTTSYTGNRAPVHIGHHFQPFMSGVYYDALKEFAEAVCGLAEVRCTTYSALADFLDATDTQKLATWQKGDFVKAPPPAELRSTPPTP